MIATAAGHSLPLLRVLERNGFAIVSRELTAHSACCVARETLRLILRQTDAEFRGLRGRVEASFDHDSYPWLRRENTAEMGPDWRGLVREVLVRTSRSSGLSLKRQPPGL